MSSPLQDSFRIPVLSSGQARKFPIFACTETGDNKIGSKHPFDGRLQQSRSTNCRFSCVRSNPKNETKRALVSPDPSFVRVARYTHDLCPCGSAVRIVPGVTLVFRTRVEWLRLRLESEDIDVQVFL